MRSPTYTKKQAKENAEKADLRKRLRDIAHGAYGGYTPLDFDSEEFGGMAAEMGLDAWSRWVGAINNALLPEGKKFLIEPRYLEAYDTLDKCVDLLWGYGIRA